jgi:cation:H+ antiporter
LFVGRVGIAVVGLVVGSELLIEGTKRLLEGLGWSATIFGSIIVAIAISLEEGFLELVPAHRGHPEISVGNVVGTIPFLLAGSLGLVGLIHPVAFGGSLRSFHAVALVVASSCCLWALTRRHTGRREGGVLIAVYGLYLAGTLVLG